MENGVAWVVGISGTTNPPPGIQLNEWSTEEPRGQTAGQQWPTGDSGYLINIFKIKL